MPELRALLNQLEKYARYPDNWDKEGALAPNELAVSAARATLLSLRPNVPLPVQVLPSVENGIGIVWEREGRYADIEFFNSGYIAAVIDGRGCGVSGVRAWEVADNNVESALNQIRSFLDGR